MFLLGMKIMSEGIQQSAGDRMRKTLNFMTGNRFAGVLTGITVTALIQSSSAATVMVVSFVNAGLLSLTQSIGVIMGANVGTTITAWIVSLLGFSLQISNLALPAVGIGFILSVIKWRHKSLGSIIMGFGLLFLGLYFLTQEMGGLYNEDNFTAIGAFRDMGFLAVIIGVAAGFVMTILIHSSSATSAIVLTMAFNGIISYEMGCGMILGASIGTTIDAVLASLGGNTAARRTALVHVLFNAIGVTWAMILFNPLLALVNFITPGIPSGIGITTHLAMFQTVYKVINTVLFFPFVNQYSRMISFFVPEKETKEKSQHYQFQYISRNTRNTTEFNILRAEKEIKDMAGLASEMYGKFSNALSSAQEKPLSEEIIKTLVEDLKESENYADEMREQITSFLIECSRDTFSTRSKGRISRLMRIIADLEDLTDDCYSASLLLEQSVTRNLVFKKKEMTALIPYVALVSQFLEFLGNISLGSTITKEQSAWALELENKIDKSRNKLKKLGRKRLEAGKNVRTELLFIDLVRRIEKLGDYCFNIVEELAK